MLPDRAWRLIWIGVLFQVLAFAVTAAWHEDNPGADPLGLLVAAYGPPVAAAVVALSGVAVGWARSERGPVHAGLALVGIGSLLQAGSLLGYAVPEATGSGSPGAALLYFLAFLLVVPGSAGSPWSAVAQPGRPASGSGRRPRHRGLATASAAAGAR